MKITKLILAAYLLMGMAACDTDKDIAVYSEDSGAIQIEAVINTVFTRSNPDATGDLQKQFNEGDEIQLSCEDGYLNYVLSEGKWVPTDNYYLRSPPFHRLTLAASLDCFKGFLLFYYFY